MPATSPDDGGGAAPLAAGRRRVVVGAAVTGAFGAFGAFGLLSGCAAPIRAPIDTRLDDGACPRFQAPVLLVLLPGLYMATDEFVREGFVAALRRRGIGADVLIADTHFGYFRDRSVLRRLRDDVLAPARARGYARVWLAGISLGGYLALAYAMENPGEVEGVVALAPYLGSAALVAEIGAAGGAAAWASTPAASRSLDGSAEDEGDTLDRRIWRWLAATTAAAHPPPLWLGYGSGDRFAAAHRLLGGLLPADRVATVAGGHEWAPWRVLWSRWLDRGLLPAGCGAA